MFARILFAAILAGIAAGVFVTAVQAYKVVPLILEAETYEGGAAAGDGHDHGEAANGENDGHSHAHDHGDGLERTAFTLLSNVLTGVAFGFLLTAAVIFSGRAISLGEGIMWGLGGFAAFSLAPSLGLPPELPGMPAADLFDRQVWWWGTVVATAAGLALLVLPKAWPVKIIGVILIVAPHVVGAPHPADLTSDVPAGLAAEFAAATLAMSALFWIVLGGAAGWLLARAGEPPEATAS